ncbi:MAG: phenylalanine--tRNA ligase subunit beta [Bacteroidota bacterium]|nr:phenylalanine--tRNA ligase subunit beta [Bacteroidota bacterium]
MKISYNWLKEYIPVNYTPEETADLLTGCGLEVEGMNIWESVKGGLEGVVIGEVLTCVKHPNSDHLSITRVDIGKGEPIQVVCGASNVAAGQKVPVATIGTKLYFGDKEIVIQRSKLRGELSEGMICAEDELGMGTSHAGIMVLDPSLRPGTPANEYFGIESDRTFEIGLTPNRSDATSHIGVARDLTAVLNVRSGASSPMIGIKFPDVSAFKPDNHKRKIDVVIEDTKACPRYSGLTILNVTVKESPQWLKNRLLSVGLRPINNIVDITNFVLMEVGQPLHAFDADKIAGEKIVVKKLAGGTKFVTLDEVEHTLTAEDLMICNMDKPMVIAGVFGGLEAGVTEKTANVFLESAYFNPRSIRKTSKYHGLQTDASFRYERGADPNITIYALKRAALLIKEIAGGEISSDIVDVYPEPIQPVIVSLSYAHLTRLVGQKLEPSKVKIILASMGMEIQEEDDRGIKIRIPLFKTDVTREADVIEEILRIYGYNNIDFSNEIRSSLFSSRKPDPERMQNLISEILCGNGFFEIMNNSLTRSDYYSGDPVFTPGKAVHMVNPLSRDLDILRQTLLFGGMETIVRNRNRKMPDCKLFEFGTVYSLAGPEQKSENPLDKYIEEKHLALFITGREYPENWNATDEPVTFFSLKGYIHAILQKLGLNLARIQSEKTTSPHFSYGLELFIKDKKIAALGSVNKDILGKFDCKQEVFYADIDWTILLQQLSPKDFNYSELPKFPEVRRDLALLIDSNVSFEEIRALAYSVEKKLLKKVGLFDVYEGEKVEAGKKSYALNFILQDDNKTLTDSDIDKVMEKMIRAFCDQLNAQLR